MMMDRLKSLLSKYPHYIHDWEYERQGVFIRNDDPMILDSDEKLAFKFDEGVEKKCRICGEVDDATGETIGNLPIGRRKTVVIDVESVSEVDFLDVDGLKQENG